MPASTSTTPAAKAGSRPRPASAVSGRADRHLRESIESGGRAEDVPIDAHRLNESRGSGAADANVVDEHQADHQRDGQMPRNDDGEEAEGRRDAHRIGRDQNVFSANRSTSRLVSMLPNQMPETRRAR